MNLKNKRFGRLIVLDSIHIPTPSKDKLFIWECLCDCGNKQRARTHDLIYGKVVSCGCKNTEHKETFKRLSPGESTFNKLWYTFKQGAKNRGHVVYINKEYFRSIIQKDCYFCGQAPREIIYKKHFGSFTANGVDRLDPSLGYTAENCVPCCSDCNYAKHRKSEAELHELIEKIYSKKIIKETPEVVQREIKGFLLKFS